MTTKILSDVTTLIPVEFDNLGGNAVSAPTGGTAVVTNDNPAVASAVVELNGGNMVLAVSPAQPAQLGALFTMSVSDTLDGTLIVTPGVTFEISADPDAANAHLNMAGATTRPLGDKPSGGTGTDSIGGGAGASIAGGGSDSTKGSTAGGASSIAGGGSGDTTGAAGAITLTGGRI